MKIIDGKHFREVKLEKLKKDLKKIDKKLGLAVIQVGNDEASKVYIKQKEKFANAVGYNFNHISFDENVELETIINKIEELNKDDTIDGILVQMPLPKHLNESIVQNAIDPLKDVDGLTYVNAGKLINNAKGLFPCTPKGIVDLLDYNEIPIEGKNIVVIGRSILVGKPIANMLLNRNASIAICHSKTKDICKYTKKADIIIVAVGKRNFLTSDMIKKGVTVIDVGINRYEGKLYGDADFENIKNKCQFITPVPGGVGPMTVAELMCNVYEAYKMKEDLK